MSKDSTPWAEYRQVLSNRNYMLLWLGQSVSQLGDAISLVAVPLLVYDLTRSAANLSLAFVFEAIPWIVIGPIAGVLIDRANRRSLLIAVDLLRMAVVLSLVFSGSVWHIYAVGFVSQVMAAIFAPARSAVIPELTGKDLYLKAISLSHSSYQLIQVAGPSIATVIIGMMGGPRTAFALDAVTFLMAASMTASIRFPQKALQPSVSTARQPFWQAIREGARFLLVTPVLRYATSINILKSLAAGFFLTGTVVYAKNGLDLSSSAGDRLYATVVAVTSLGTVLGTWCISVWEKRVRRFSLIAVGLMAQGAAYLLILLRPGPYGLTALAFVAGLASSGALTPVSACYAEYTPNEIRGRVYSATNSLLQVMSVLSFTLAGAMGDAYGPASMLTIAGLLLVFLTPIFSLVFKGSQSLTGREPSP